MEQIDDPLVHDGCGMFRSSCALLSRIRAATGRRRGQGHAVESGSRRESREGQGARHVQQGRRRIPGPGPLSVCVNSGDGKIVAVGNPNAKQIIGQDLRTLKDSTGKSFGVEQFAAAQKPEGELTEVSYLFSKPGADPTPVAKVSFTTKIGDLVCGVGYYK